MTGTCDMNQSISIDDASSSSDFEDERDYVDDADTIDYDGLGNDSSQNVDYQYGRRSGNDKKKNVPGMKKIANSTFHWKLFVICLMIINTTIVVIATILYMNHLSGKEFERAFNNAALTVADATHYHMEGITNSLDVLGESVTSYCLDTQAQWPYVTLPNFEERVAPIRAASGLTVMGYLPLVQTQERLPWEVYAVHEQGWIQDSYNTLLLQLQPQDESEARITPEDQALHNHTTNTNSEGDYSYSISDEIMVLYQPPYAQGPYAPIWQVSPPPPPSETAVINTDLMSSDNLRLLFESLLSQNQSEPDFAISHIVPKSLYTTNATSTKLLDSESVTTTTASSTSRHTSGDTPLPKPLQPHYTYSSTYSQGEDESPQSFVFHPIYTSYHHHGEIEGFAMGVLPWEDFFSNLLPDEVQGIVCVLTNPCSGQSHTFLLAGRVAIFLGEGDLHDVAFNKLTHQAVLSETVSYGLSFGGQGPGEEEVTPCHYVIDIYPSTEFSSEMHSDGPIIFTISIACVFIVTGLVFLAYVYLIGNRQNKVMAIAMSTSAVVSSLFPSTVRDRILQEAEAKVKTRMSSVSSSRRSKSGSIRNSRRQEEHQQQQKRRRSKPNADLFPETTVLFADIVGFTAWSSIREPTQVFELLETIYHSFDEIARRRQVFKVETIGDCYVAVTGLPEPCKDHAVVMCRFARDCLHVMGILTKKLEVQLGPDTGELSMRFGLHSGPVTAGVLRGERSRFQLFGDTVNTAARMESNGVREKIHISEQTAAQLRQSGKEDWFVPREDKIIAKGKGELNTYWLHTKQSSAAPMSDVSSNDNDSVMLNIDDWMDLPTELFDSQRSKLGLANNEIRQCLSEQNQRLAEWNSNQLKMLLTNVVACRKAVMQSVAEEGKKNDEHGETFLGNSHIGVGDSGSILKQAGKTIEMPGYDGRVFAEVERSSVKLDELVQQQLHDYVAIICSMYTDHCFHSYQHASHVTMNIVKLLSSIAATPHQRNFQDDESSKRMSTMDEERGEQNHLKTFGISSDPMTQFALAFASLIHDVDHPGVPNSQLVKENSRLARIFGCVVAEQNSFQTAWDLLMDPGFDQLRGAIYTTNEECNRFKQLVVNAVVATDLFDEELNADRQKRWDMAFPQVPDTQVPLLESSKEDQKDLVDRRATVVVEYMMQASDVAHTMQHWHVYRKWNSRFFLECYKAYKDGRAERDPSEFWYQAELDFFDNTVIPLAKKMKECGAFGAGADEYLGYGEQNRHEWERQGQEIVKEMQFTFEQLGIGTTRHDDTEDDPFQDQQ